jgi:hypothetical protein
MGILCPMLTIPQLQQIEGDNPYLYEALKRIVGAVNSLGSRIGVDPAPAVQSTPGATIAPPPAPAAMQVTGARGTFSVLIAPPLGVASSSTVISSEARNLSSSLISYFLEAAADAAFTQPLVYPLGGSLTASISLGNVTRYWRARAKYLDSDYGPYVYFGTAAQPAAVVGGAVTSSDLAANIASNFTNFAVVDSIDAGSSATVRIHGSAGVGTSWMRITGAGTQTLPAGSIPGLAYATTYFIAWNGATYLALTSVSAALADGLIAVGKVVTVSAGGGGGSTGGGGSSGGSGGGPPLIE